MFISIRAISLAEGSQRGTSERSGEGTSKNLQRRADVSRSIVKEQSSHASKDPKRKGRRRDDDCLLEELERAPRPRGCFSKGRLYVTPTNDSQYSLYVPFDLYPPCLRLIYSPPARCLCL